MKCAPVPASSQASTRSGLARLVRARRGAAADPPLCRSIKTTRPSLVSLLPPSFLFTPWPSPSLLQLSGACLTGRPSSIALPRPCTRRFAKPPSYRSSALHPSSYLLPFASLSFSPAQSDPKLERATEPHPLIRCSLSPHRCSNSARTETVLFRGELKDSLCSTLPLWTLMPLLPASTTVSPLLS